MVDYVPHCDNSYNVLFAAALESLQSRLSKLEEIVGKLPGSAPPPTSVAPAHAPEDDDDDFDLFGSEEEAESEEQADQRATALAKYNEKKSKSKCRNVVYLAYKSPLHL